MVPCQLVSDKRMTRENKQKEEISVLIITKNEEAKIKGCLESVAWADEIVLVDTGSDSHDKTNKIARKYGAQVYKYTQGSYDAWRSFALTKAKYDWVLYVDADERVTSDLRREIDSVLTGRYQFLPQFTAFAIPRRNIILGKEMRHGGWWPDYVKRLFRKDSLRSWTGNLHEEPVFEGSLGHLKNAFIHEKHATLSEMVEKTNKWSEVEAKLILDSGHPQMVWWRFMRIMATEFWLRMVVHKGFMDGAEGVIYALYQVWSRFLTYAKLWEMQSLVYKKK